MNSEKTYIVRDRKALLKPEAIEELDAFTRKKKDSLLTKLKKIVASFFTFNDPRHANALVEKNEK